MITYNKTFSATAVLITALSVISCSQSPGEQAANTDITLSEDTSIVTTDAAITGPYLALSKSKVNVNEGEAFTLDVTVNDFVISEGGGVSVFFDPASVQVTAVSVDNDVWDFVNKDGTINNARGTVSDILFSSYQGVSGNARVATIEFKSIKKGTTELTLKEATANPFASNGQVMAVSFKSTTVVAN